MTIEVTTLKNGMKVVSDRIDAVETISCGVWVPVGTRHETKDINGVSHFLEHMAFKGTHKRSAVQIAHEIESLGGYLNAYTGREVTAYYARALKEDLALSVDILADILQNSAFEEVEFERERGVILQEIGQTLDTPDDIVFDYYQELCYPDQPMGWSILGPESIIKDISPAAVKGYMQKNYSLSDMVLSAAGNVCHQTLVDLANRLFIGGETLKQDLVKKGEIIKANYQSGKTNISKDLEQAHVVLGFEGLPYGHPHYYDGMLYSMMMGGGMSSRLFQEIREKRGLVYTIQTSTASYRDSGQFYVYAGTDPSDVQDLLPVVEEELQKATKGFALDELNRAKAQLKAGLMMGLESTSNRCERLANQMLVHGRPITAQEIANKVEAVSLDSVLLYANNLLNKKKNLIVYGCEK